MKQISSEEGLYTVAEYLTSERAAELKHEYISGEVVAMAGATREHSLITGNIAQRLGNQPSEYGFCRHDSYDPLRASPNEFFAPFDGQSRS